MYFCYARGKVLSFPGNLCHLSVEILTCGVSDLVHLSKVHDILGECGVGIAHIEPPLLVGVLLQVATHMGLVRPPVPKLVQPLPHHHHGGRRRHPRHRHLWVQQSPRPMGVKYK